MYKYVYITGSKVTRKWTPIPYFYSDSVRSMREKNTIYVCMYIYIYICKHIISYYLQYICIYLPRDPCMVDLQFTYICFLPVSVDRYTMTMGPMGIGLHRYHIRIPTARIYAATTTSSRESNIQKLSACPPSSSNLPTCLGK